MGLSLKDIGKRIEGLGAQINPFDNGATYSTVVNNRPPAPAPAAIQQRPQLGFNSFNAPQPAFSNQPTLNAPSGPSFLNQAEGFGKGLLSADKFIANNLGLTNVATIDNPLTPQSKRTEAAKQLVVGAVKFPIQAGQQLGNTLNVAMGNPQPQGTAPALQTQFKQTKKTNGTLPAVGQTAFSAASDVLPLLGAVKLAPEVPERNQVGAVGKNVNESPLPFPGKPPVIKSTPVKSIVKAGQGSEQIPNTPPNFLKTDAGYVPKTPAELSSLSPAEQQVLTKPAVGLAAPDINTAANPYMSLITRVQPGDYSHAIQNSQLVSRPIETAGSLWQRSMQKLSPDERANFWRAVENPTGKHSPELQDAIDQWRAVDNKVHGESQALGGNTNYLTDHALHPWQLPEDYANHIINGGSPSKFKGLNNISRKYRTIAEGEANGLSLGTDPISEGTRYLQANSAILRKQALKQGLAEADNLHETKPNSLDLGGGHTVPLSDEGLRAARSLQKFVPTDNKAVVGLRTANQGAKSTILSLGQFHTINIGALRAAPTLIANGHPLAAAKGLYGMFRGAFGNEYADRVIGSAIKDGTVDKAAQIGMPYGGSGYDVSGTILKHGVGSRTVFGKQIPMMHDQVVRSIISDLDKRGVPLDSPEARNAGLAGANMMGELNQELQHVSPRMQRTMTDALLAGQFTPSKFLQIKRAFTPSSYKGGGVAGQYAATNVLANVAATTAVIAGIGYLAGQKSDDLKDLLLRALIDPAAPTNQKDSKGNTIKLRTPGTDTSDIAKLLGITLVRNSDGHLGVSWKGFNAGTVEDFGKSRLSPILSSGLKVRTNQNYSGKPLYDPNAPAGTKALQGATSIIAGNLPIGLQGLPQTNAIESHLPGSVQEVLNAQKPGSNPLLKSAGSSFGLTPSTDATVGKGQQTAQYYTALDQAKKGLDRQSADALDLYTGSKKNPVTGAYDVQPNANDPRAKATVILQNPKALTNLINMNKTLAGEGQNVDPLWGLSKDQITKYLQYQAMPPGSADKTDWYNKNQSWYAPLVDQRNQFFGSLPPGDPNKPKLNIQYPTATPQVSALETAYSNLTDSTQKAQLLNDHPELIQQWNAQANYTNQMRQALGYSPIKGYPEPTPQIQTFLNTYTNSSKAQRSALRASNPQGYQAMIGYFDNVDLYNINKQGAVSQLQGEPDQTSKQNKAISSLAQDIYQSPQGTYSIQPAGWMNGLSNSSSSSGSSYKPYIRTAKQSKKTTKFAVKGAKVSFKKGKAIGDKDRNKSPAKAKVSLKPSLV